GPGVHTFSTRQSSLDGFDARFCMIWISGVLNPGSCGHDGPSSNASRVPAHGAGFVGGMNRFAPAVEAPYGMPLNVLIPFTIRPRTFPKVVSTTTSAGRLFAVCAGAAELSRDTRASAAPACVVCV